MIKIYINSEYFKGHLTKVAQSIVGLGSSFSSTITSLESNLSSPIVSKTTNTKRPIKQIKKKLDISSTISKIRDKADLQPLHKDTGTFRSIKDRPNITRMTNKQKYLGHLEDKRITNHHLRNK